jgi:hypothetical protein
LKPTGSLAASIIPNPKPPDHSRATFRFEVEPELYAEGLGVDPRTDLDNLRMPETDLGHGRSKRASASGASL